MTHTNFIFATRSQLPASKANAVQSIHMALSLGKRFEQFQPIFLTQEKDPIPDTYFAPFKANAPNKLKLIKLSAKTEWSHKYVIQFLRHFQKCAPSTIVYTRSTRIAWAACKANRNCILELHDPLIPIRIRALNSMFSKGNLKGIVATTTRLKNDIIEATNISSCKVTVFGGAACKEYIEVTHIENDLIDTAKFNVAYSGSALVGKGLEIVLKCAALAPKIAFHIIGPSIKEAKKLGPISSNLTFHGFKQGEAIIGLLKQMNALLLPNQKSVIIGSGADIGKHTSPLKLFEYMSTGTPIIASNLPIFHETLSHKKNALLCRSNSPDDFCRKIEELQQDTALAIQLGKTAQENFLNNYTWDHRVDHIVQFITKLGILKQSSKE